MKKYPWYALLIAVYSPLALLAENIGEVGFLAANRTIIFLLLSEVLLLLFFYKVYDDWQKAGFASVLLTILMVFYGHVYSLLENTEIFGVLIGRHRYLLVLWIVLTTFIFYVTGKIKQFSVFEDAAKVIFIALIVFAMANISIFYYLEWRTVQERNASNVSRQITQIKASPGAFPDVYYIILDAYGRSDVLSSKFNIKNDDFLDSLRSKGFFVADCSLSNYAHTHLSLSSSLNYSYLDELGSNFVPGNKGWAGLRDLIHNNSVRQFFEEKGYQVIAFETGFAWTEWRDADLFVENKTSFLSRNLTSFESLFLYTTVGAILIDFEVIPEPQQAVRHYEMISANLDALEDLAGEDSPKFIFAHLIIPHHPFVFDSEGKYRRDPSLSPAFDKYTDEEYYNGYGQQVKFINERILEIVEAILSNSERQPIIIIQGDHGPSHAGEIARISILNAYYLPDGPVDQLDPRITPVNTFRVILNTYFDQSLPMLPDTSYFSKNSDPYAYTVIPNECKP